MKNVLFVCEGKLDKRNWSGTTYNLYKMIEKQFENVDVLELLPNGLLKKVINKANHFVKGELEYNRTKIATKLYAESIEAAVKKKEYDFIFAVGSVSISQVKNCNVPIYLFVDSVMNIMVDYYDYFRAFSDYSKKISEELEFKALNNATKIFACTNWCKDAIVNHYGIDNNKVILTKIGSNNEDNLSDNELKEIMKERQDSIDKELRLLFVGVEWERKGGNKALEIYRNLKERKINVSLDIVGVNPPMDLSEDSDIHVHGFLSKKKDEEARKLIELYKKAHFFVLPTVAECAGVVFCESSAFALPSIANKTGGVEDIVENGVNGYCKDLYSEETDKVCDWIMTLYNDKDAYKKLMETTLDYYKESLNWDKVGEIIQKNID